MMALNDPDHLLAPNNPEHLFPIYKYFRYEHLPPKLQDVSRHVFELAELMMNALPNGAEKAAGLRKLLEAKDCFVRAALGED